MNSFAMRNSQMKMHPSDQIDLVDEDHDYASDKEESSPFFTVRDLN